MIAGVQVRTDDKERYSINDLHKAAGGENRQRPSMWLENQQTKALVDELEKAGIPAFESKQRQGTFVVKELVYAYAMWLSPAFNLTVIRAFDALANGRVEEAQRIAARQQAKLEAPFMADALKYCREVEGKVTMPYHYSNEHDLVNRVALGVTSKGYRTAHGIGVDEPIRDSMTRLQAECIQHLQRANTTMIEIGMGFDARKVELKKIYMSRHAPGLLEEVKRLES